MSLAPRLTRGSLDLTCTPCSNTVSLLNCSVFSPNTLGTVKLRQLVPTSSLPPTLSWYPPISSPSGFYTPHPSLRPSLRLTTNPLLVPTTHPSVFRLPDSPPLLMMSRPSLGTHLVPTTVTPEPGYSHIQEALKVSESSLKALCRIYEGSLKSLPRLSEGSLTAL